MLSRLARNLNINALKKKYAIRCFSNLNLFEKYSGAKKNTAIGKGSGNANIENMSSKIEKKSEINVKSNKSTKGIDTNNSTSAKAKSKKINTKEDNSKVEKNTKKSLDSKTKQEKSLKSDSTINKMSDIKDKTKPVKVVSATKSENPKRSKSLKQENKENSDIPKIVRSKSAKQEIVEDSPIHEPALKSKGLKKESEEEEQNKNIEKLSERNVIRSKNLDKQDNDHKEEKPNAKNKNTGIDTSYRSVKKPRINRTENTSYNRAIFLNKKILGKIRNNEDLIMDVLTSHEGALFDEYIEKFASIDTKNAIQKERRNLCNNYAPLPVVLKKGNGIYVQDVDKDWFMDFLSGYSAVNHGHLNTNIIESAYSQMKTLYMTSRAFYNEVLGKAAETICKMFGYEKVLFMNSGVEAGESAIKIARRWGYDVKGIPDNQAKIVFAKQNFWGRTIYACGTSDDPSRYSKFGPYDNESKYLVDYNNVEEIANVLANDPNICAIFLEPIQGEGGVKIPDSNYLANVKRLCEEYNCLLIVDEIQTGIGRAGHLIYSEASGVKPDIVLLAKSISGGLYPISAVLSSRAIMDTIKPGEHGSTYGGNPLAAQILISALEEVNNLNLVNNAKEMGIELSVGLKELEFCKFVKEIRGRGLMFGLELQEDCPFTAYDLSMWLMQKGLLTKPTKLYTLRLTPPLIINRQEIKN
jgi:ornithine--oxo-acid transaminase